MPKEIQGNSLTENVTFIESKKQQRKRIHENVLQLAEKRNTDIQNEMKTDNQDNDFKNAISKSILKFANEKNYDQKD